MNQLLDAIKADDRLQDVRHIAYLLATIHHETAATFKPIVERGDRDYFTRYDHTTRIGARLGNTAPGDGFKFRGRGYVQITGRANYSKFAMLLKAPILDHPDLALDHKTAYEIAVLGMTKGLFTGVSLNDYFDERETNWIDARKIINGLDCAEKIAHKAKYYFDAMQKGGLDAIRF